MVLPTSQHSEAPLATAAVGGEHANTTSATTTKNRRKSKQKQFGDQEAAPQSAPYHHHQQPLAVQQLLVDLRLQVEYYFQNFMHDAFLQQFAMQYGGAVPTSVVAGFPRLRELVSMATNNSANGAMHHQHQQQDEMALVVQALQGSEFVGLSDDGLWMFPLLQQQQQQQLSYYNGGGPPPPQSATGAMPLMMAASLESSPSCDTADSNQLDGNNNNNNNNKSSEGNNERTTIVVGDVSVDVPVAEVLRAFSTDAGVVPTDAKPDHNAGNTWYLIFDSEREALEALQASTKNQIAGQAVQASLKKAEPRALSPTSTTPTDSSTSIDGSQPSQQHDERSHYHSYNNDNNSPCPRQYEMMHNQYTNHNHHHHQYQQQYHHHQQQQQSYMMYAMQQQQGYHHADGMMYPQSGHSNVVQCGVAVGMYPPGNHYGHYGHGHAGGMAMDHHHQQQQQQQQHSSQQQMIQAGCPVYMDDGSEYHKQEQQQGQQVSSEHDVGQEQEQEQPSSKGSSGGKHAQNQNGSKNKNITSNADNKNIGKPKKKKSVQTNAAKKKKTSSKGAVSAPAPGWKANMNSKATKVECPKGEQRSDPSASSFKEKILLSRGGKSGKKDLPDPTNAAVPESAPPPPPPSSKSNDTIAGKDANNLPTASSGTASFAKPVDCDLNLDEGIGTPPPSSSGGYSAPIAKKSDAGEPVESVFSKGSDFCKPKGRNKEIGTKDSDAKVEAKQNVDDKPNPPKKQASKKKKDKKQQQLEAEMLSEASFPSLPGGGVNCSSKSTQKGVTSSSKPAPFAYAAALLKPSSTNFTATTTAASAPSKPSIAGDGIQGDFAKLAMEPYANENNCW